MPPTRTGDDSKASKGAVEGSPEGVLGDAWFWWCVWDVVGGVTTEHSVAITWVMGVLLVGVLVVGVLVVGVEK